MNTVLTFPGVSSKNYGRNIVYLTRSDKNNSKTEFLKGLNSRNICAIDLDSVKDDFDQLRDDRGRNLEKLKSVDAFFRSSDGKFYFVEFKNATSESLDAIDEGEPINVSLRKKAFDSITLSGLTVTQDVVGKTLMKNAILIVVYKSSPIDSLAAIGFGNSLARRANGLKGSTEYPIKWGLNALKTSGLYDDVYTWPDNKFENWAIDKLK